VRLSGRSAVPYRGEVDDLIVQAAWFILRGFGLKDAVIAAHKVPPPGACGGNGALRSHGDV
jgi:hypothetical protein